MRVRNRKGSLPDPLSGEQGTIFKDARYTVALGYPAPYRVGASSLGAQVVYGAFNSITDLRCERFFYPEKGRPLLPLLTAESGVPVGGAAAIAFSLACETELAKVAQLLEAAGLHPLAEQRAPDDPPIIAGGPLTILDPYLLAPFADLVAVGEADETLAPLGAAITETANKEALLSEINQRGLRLWRPMFDLEPPSPTSAPPDLLPAKACTWSRNAEFKDLFLIEATRGCPRQCAFCVISRKSQGGSRFRAAPVERILESIPQAAPGVGLVGAAVTDHPEIERIVARLVESHKRVSLSSMRADRITPDLAVYLKKGGLRTLTVAADGSSERLRTAVKKGISQRHLERAAAIGADAGIQNLRIYSMIGLPGEEDSDVEEFANLLLKLARSMRVSATVQAFVPKPGTELADVPMAELSTLNHRLSLLKSRTQGKVRLLPTSPRWSWIDWRLAHGGKRSFLAAIEAQKEGANHAAWKRAISRFIF
jgi:radical SAM superfamily enzyme YgiQ (UPF0313 family)